MKDIVKPGLLASLVMLVVGMALNVIGGELFPSVGESYYNTDIYRPWEDPLMSLMFLQPIIMGFGFAWVWSKIKGAVKGSQNEQARNVATGLWLVSTFPGIVITYASFQISLLTALLWAVAGFFTIWAGMVVVVKTSK